MIKKLHEKTIKFCGFIYTQRKSLIFSAFLLLEFPLFNIFFFCFFLFSDNTHFIYLIKLSLPQNKKKKKTKKSFWEKCIKTQPKKENYYNIEREKGKQKQKSKKKTENDEKIALFPSSYFNTEDGFFLFLLLSGI